MESLYYTNLGKQAIHLLIKKFLCVDMNILNAGKKNNCSLQIYLKYNCFSLKNVIRGYIFNLKKKCYNKMQSTKVTSIADLAFPSNSQFSI